MLGKGYYVMAVGEGHGNYSPTLYSLLNTPAKLSV
jgi:hypothetical protein